MDGGYDVWCTSTTTATQDAPRDARPAARERVGDADRQRTADLLVRAAGSGHLDLDQLDGRMADVWAARTGADLLRLEADLPATLLEERAREEAQRARQSQARAGLRGHVLTYLAVMTLLVGLWLAGGLSSGDWYPWPVWPALGWGVAVAGQARTALSPAR